MRKPHDYHYIYKTTCNVTQKYYIGMHSTSNLEDGYIGSGKQLWRSIRKHGKENHEVEILEWFLDRNSLKERERELVNEDLLKEDLCMNLVIGGNGFLDPNHQFKCSSEGGKGLGKRLAEDPEKKAKFGEKVRQNNIARKGKKMFKNEHTKGSCWITNNETGQNKLVKLELVDEFLKQNWRKGIERKTSNGEGESNSQFGTVWIKNSIETKKVKKEDLDYYLSIGWFRGRLKL